MFEPMYVKNMYSNYDLIIIITDPELIANEADAIFDRRERMDVKKPGPFFEASPNNFYLDKLVGLDLGYEKHNVDISYRKDIPYFFYLKYKK